MAAARSATYSGGGFDRHQLRLQETQCVSEAAGPRPGTAECADLIVKHLEGDRLRAVWQNLDKLMLALNVKAVWLTKTAALELARHAIRVNAICPAPIETPMAQALEVGVKRERLIATIPLRRYGTPEEVSDEAAYVTGGVYTVDGGAIA